MNLVEKLKNVPKGTTMYSPLFKGPVKFVEISKGTLYPIVCKTYIGELFFLTQEGYHTAEIASQNCMLFPTPEMTWEGYEYIPDGTLCVVNEQHFIYQIMSAKGGWYKCQDINVHWIYFVSEHRLGDLDSALYTKRLTIEEIEDVLDCLKKEGYKIVGNELQKIEPKFNKGDIIVNNLGTIAVFDHLKNGTRPDVVVYKAVRCPTIDWIKVKTDIGIGYASDYRLATEEEKVSFLESLNNAGYEFDGVNVIPKKCEFTPFEKVLVRDRDIHPWKCDFFSHPDEGFHYKFTCTGSHYAQCIPYNEETKHLVGTTDMPPKKYIIWE